VRVVRDPAGVVSLDRAHRIAGRGAYLCADGSCWQQALKRSALERALRTPLPKDLKDILEHGDVAAVRVASDHVAPATITGGAHGA
jgi:predicted RNA-binding protein YlxR (DUF448 family)